MLVAVIFVILLSILVFLVSILDIVDPINQRFLTAIAFAVSVPVTVLALYGPRTVQLLQGHKITASMRIQDGANTEGAEEKRKLLNSAKDALRAIKSEEGKCLLCVDQIAYWYATLTAINTNEFHDSSGAGGTDKAMQHSRGIGSSLKASIKGNKYQRDSNNSESEVKGIPNTRKAGSQFKASSVVE